MAVSGAAVRGEEEEEEEEMDHGSSTVSSSKQAAGLGTEVKWKQQQQEG